MKEIGGYFGLELNKGVEYHNNAIKLNTGRNCLEYILRAKEYKKIFIPYFTCDVILEPIHKLGLEYEFYRIDKNLEPVFDKNVSDGEAFLYTNYFGIKSKKVKELSDFIPNLIIDNSQAFFASTIENIDTFYSARKFFGVPDGAYLYTNKILNENFDQDVSFNRFTHLLKRIDIGATEGFLDFKDNDKSLENQDIKLMSKLSSTILCSIDYDKSKSVRKRNFEYLHSILKNSNEINIDVELNDVPLVYPLLFRKSGLKEILIENKIFVATYWPNVLNWVDKDSVEADLVNNLVHIPIDQRYEIENLEIIKTLIWKYI